MTKMKTLEEDGGSAFPPGGWGEGMTLRDWFAGQALSVLARGHTDRTRAATSAYEIADAMIKARKGE